MATPTEFLTPDRHAEGHRRAAALFFATMLGVVLTSALIAVLMFAVAGQPTGPGRLFPPAFAVSSGLLFAGSLALTRAVRCVRVERQRPFRRWLLTSLLLATLFMGIQTYGLACLLPHDRTASAASTGVTAFVLALASLHGMHFIVATLFLAMVTVRAFAERYDHEYYWGVSACAWFWHALGLVWLAILAVFAIAA